MYYYLTFNRHQELEQNYEIKFLTFGLVFKMYFLVGILASSQKNIRGKYITTAHYKCKLIV